jgi:ribosomal protein S18 acetylase RimI-like enzyme
MSSNPPSGISLRPYRAEDQELLFAIYAGTRKDEVAAFGWNAAQQEVFLRMQFNAQRRGYEAAYPQADHQIICLEGQPIGRIMVQRAADHAHLVDIALLPEYRGRGIGGALLRELIAESDQNRVPVRLNVHRTNAGAWRLYDRLGFIQTGEDEIYYQMERPPI